MLLTDVAQKTWSQKHVNMSSFRHHFIITCNLFIGDHVRGIKASPITQTPEPELDVLGDDIGQGAGGAGCPIPAVDTVPGVTGIVNPALIRFIPFKY